MHRFTHSKKHLHTVGKPPLTRELLRRSRSVTLMMIRTHLDVPSRTSGSRGSTETEATDCCQWSVGQPPCRTPGRAWAAKLLGWNGPLCVGVQEVVGGQAGARPGACQPGRGRGTRRRLPTRS